ncbi:integrase [Streptomyces yaizuensis]|uniref:Integrase n=1 Tax=Streptomyces yaizuensis TaxID=2989713 RepID=A0ABQ5NXY9_9ACTN|nr:integrase [Streptomyces sp. YSPA8]GLF95221.1 integrase [Streptomyces sp. YSPA8]
MSSGEGIPATTVPGWRGWPGPRCTEWFNWLTGAGIDSLEDVTQEVCERYLEERRWSVPVPGRPRRRLDPATVAEHVQVLQLLALYGELLSTDRYTAGFMPWKGRTAARVSGRARTGNRTLPVPDAVLQPLLATCLFMVDVVGPHFADLLDEVRADTSVAGALPRVTMTRVPGLRRVIAEMRAAGEPFPAVGEKEMSRRISRCGDGPLSALCWSGLARRVGANRVTGEAREAVLPLLVEAAGELGFQRPWPRQTAAVARLNDGALILWTAPVAADDLPTTAGYVVTACLVLTCALTGMRSSELLEIEAGCRRPALVTPGGGRRFRLSGRLIKGQRFGGVPDEWVVVEEADRAVALAERLLARPRGTALFPSVDLPDRVNNLRDWLERTGYGERWGLPVIPKGPVNARMLRRTLALSIAERPGGLLAAKVALKHISVATTEGYAARPGGSQRLFHAEMREAEEARHVQLTVEAFRDAQAGIMPAGPGATSLIEAFSHVDALLKETARTDPKVLNDDRHLESLLRKQARTLHVGPANFCWFRDPSKALCLRLAGTPDAKKPLVGMCDSARCPQATHHPCHRPAWAGQAQAIDIFIESPRVTQGEKKRLIPERDRALRVVAAIDAATAAGED